MAPIDQAVSVTTGVVKFGFGFVNAAAVAAWSDPFETRPHAARHTPRRPLSDRIQQIASPSSIPAPSSRRKLTGAQLVPSHD